MHWDRKTPLYDEISDKYYLCFDDIEEYVEEYKEDNEGEMPSFRMVICDPVTYSQIEPDHWYDDLPEDGETEPQLLVKVHELNEFIKSLPAACWQPGKYRTSVEINF